MDVAFEFYENAESFLQSYIPEDHGCIVSAFRLLGMNGIAMQDALLKQQFPVSVEFRRQLRIGWDFWHLSQRYRSCEVVGRSISLPKLR